MCTKMGLHGILIVAMLAWAANPAAADLNEGLVVLHNFDEVVDASGNGLNLLLEGDAYLEDGMLWLDGEDDWADVGSFEDFSPVNPLADEEGAPSDFTLVIAYASEWEEDSSALVSIGPAIGSGTGDLSLFYSPTGLYIDHWWVDATAGMEVESGGEVVWVIVTYSVDEGYSFFHLEDGSVTEMVAGEPMDWQGVWNPDLDYGARLGFFANETLVIEESEAWQGWFEGRIDHFAMWSRVLDEEEMLQVPEFGGGAVSGKAGNPDPPDEDDFVPRDTELSWRAGPFAVTHDVYFGTSFDDVNEAGSDSALRVLAGTTETGYDPTPDDGLLDWGQTYFWRIDEVNDADPNSPWKGNTWSFTVEPYWYALDPELDQYGEITASSVEDPEEIFPDATVWDGLEDNDKHIDELWAMWLSSPDDMNGVAWIQYPFDRAYRLQQIEIWNFNDEVEPDLGFGFDETVIEYTTDDPEAEEMTWTELMTVNLNPAPGEPTGPTDTLDLQGTVATGLRLTAKSNQSGFNDQFGLSHVRIHYLPVRAMDPVPEPEADVSVEDLALEWRAGREASTHKVYLGTDEENLDLVDTVTETGYEPESLALGTEYFWRIDETEDPALAGVVWSFTTNEFLTVDDMEGYEDSADDATVAVWGAWADGTDDPTNGSFVGDDAGGTEKDITHGDSDQSMPLEYDNTGAAVTSEATLTYDEVEDWTRSEVRALTFYVHGGEDNVNGQMYVKVNGVKLSVGADLAEESWQEVNIDLANLAAEGADLQSVTSLTIGIEGANSSGTVFIDNVRLYPRRCVAALAPEGDLNGDCIVDEEDLAIITDNWLASGVPLVEYTFDSDLSDSAGHYDGVVDANAGVVEDGVLVLDGTNYVDIAFGADNPFDGTVDYSLALDFQTDEPGTLFSSARDGQGSNHALAVFIANGENAADGAVVVDHFWIALAEAGADAYDGEWHTVVVTYTLASQTIVIYLDGEASDPWEVDVELPIIPNVEEDTVRIGASRNPNYPFGYPGAPEPEFATDGPFVGSIDNVRVFGFAMTPDAAAALPDTLPLHPADVNGDGVVDQADKDIVEANMGVEQLWP